MAIQKKSEVLKKKPTAPVDEEEEDTSADTGAAPAEEEKDGEEAAAPAAKTGAKVKVEAKADEELVALFEGYDENVAAAEKSFIELLEHIQEKQLDRATVVASIMKARGCNFETAQQHYARMKKIYNNEEVLADLKAGKITMKVAREKVTNKQKHPKSAKPEQKEAKFTNTLKNFVAAAKESGFSRAEIMVTVEAELKSASIK